MVQSFHRDRSANCHASVSTSFQASKIPEFSTLLVEHFFAAAVFIAFGVLSRFDGDDFLLFLGTSS